METSPVTCRTLEDFYHINGHTFEKQYKETLSGYRDWEQLSHADKWTTTQKQRAKILFREYPKLKIAYGLCHSLRMIFAKNTIKDAARLSMAKWYNKVEEAGFHSFNVIAATFYEHYNDILNFYNNRASNAAAESFNSKIKLFRANLRGVTDKKFFIFRLSKLYGYPH